MMNSEFVNHFVCSFGSSCVPRPVYVDRLRWSSLFVRWNRRGRLRRNLTRVDVLGGIWFESRGAPNGARKIEIRLAT